MIRPSCGSSVRSAVESSLRSLSSPVPSLLPWQDYRITTGLLAEWAFSEGSGRSVADNSGNGKTINLDLPTSPNDTWTARGIATSAGLVQTPSITGARTIVALIKVPRSLTGAFIISAGNSSGHGAYVEGSNNDYTYHTGSVRGVVPLWSRTSTKQGAYRLITGGWYMLFMDMAFAKTTPIGFGGRHSTTTSRLATFEIAYASVFSGVLSDADRSQMYLLGRSLLKARGAYLDYRDCPTQGDLVGIWGQSNAEGRCDISALSAPDQARTTPADTWISHRNMRTPAPLVMGANQQAQTLSRFGPEMGLAWSHEDAANPSKLYISTYAVGSTFLATTGGADWNINEDVVGGYASLGIFNLWAAEADMMLAGIAPRLRGIFWMQGENDATNLAYGAAYQANLEALISKVREQLGDSAAKFLIARIRNLDPTFIAQAAIDVRAAQSTIGAQAGNAWFDTDDLPLLGDNVHYNAAGMKTLGQRVYQNLF
jgi:hypothetical protein